MSSSNRGDILQSVWDSGLYDLETHCFSPWPGVRRHKTGAIIKCILLEHKKDLSE